MLMTHVEWQAGLTLVNKYTGEYCGLLRAHAPIHDKAVAYLRLSETRQFSSCNIIRVTFAVFSDVKQCKCCLRSLLYAKATPWKGLEETWLQLFQRQSKCSFCNIFRSCWRTLSLKGLEHPSLFRQTGRFRQKEDTTNLEDSFLREIEKQSARCYAAILQFLHCNLLLLF